MITSATFRGKRYAVLGLARSGLATISALLESGAQVTAWDSREEAHLAADPRVTIADFEREGLAGFDAIIVSPGVPLNRHPIRLQAAQANVPIIGDIELFAQARAGLPAHRVVAITGTNGKSTTTALIHHIIAQAGIPTMMGGNIGLPILGQQPLPAGGVYVLELSSYQIDITNTLDCDVALLLNITPDHLDRYDGFAGYAASKARLFAMQSADHAAIIVDEDAPSAAIADQVGARAIRLKTGAVEGQADWPTLQGPHNAQNVAAAVAATKALGINDTVIAQALRTYPGLPHRMERTKTIGNVLYVNDSKATNATSTAPALAAFPRVHWIVGGRRKTDDLDACLVHKDHIVAAYTIGESTDFFAALLQGAGVDTLASGNLAQAVQDAAKAAQAGEVVLLSPACASFDQFSDFEARGQAFRDAVEALA